MSYRRTRGSVCTLLLSRVSRFALWPRVVGEVGPAASALGAALLTLSVSSLTPSLFRTGHPEWGQDILLPLIDGYVASGELDEEFAKGARERARAHHDGESLGRALLKVLGVA